MATITLERTRKWRLGEAPQSRFQAVESPLPAKPAVEDCCPHCNLPHRIQRKNTFQRLKSAILQLLTALIAIVFAILRMARFSVGVVLCVVGVVGFGLQRLGTFIVHPEDRRLLPSADNGSER